MKKVMLVSFSLENKVIDKLNELPRKNLPNKSALVNRLIKAWLVEQGYIVSGSI